MKTCKKLLAITIALVLLVSTLVSGLVVSAADATTTLAIGTTTIKEGTTTADVEFVLTFAAPTKTPHSLCTITAADGLTLTAIEVDQAKTKYVKQGEDGQWVDDELITDEEAKVTIDNDGKNLAAGKVLVESAADSKAPTVTFITFVATFAVAEGLKEGTYNVSAEADATNWDEDDIAVTVKSGAVVVAHEHDYEETVTAPTCVAAGYTTYKCACGHEYTVDGEPATGVHTYGEDGKCSVCGAEEPVEEPECEHANTTFVSAVPATETETGTVTFICDDCGENIIETVSYSSSVALTGTPGIGCASTTQLMLKLNPKNYTNASKGIVVYTHHYGNGAEATVDTLDVTSEFIDSADGYYKWNLPVKYTQFTDIYECYLYTKGANGWVNGKVREYSIKSAAMSVIKSASMASGMKKAAANLLKAGAAAQTTFNYATTDLADVELTGDYAQYVTTTTSTPVKDDTNWIKVPDDYKETKKVIYASPSVLLDDAVAILHKVNPTYFEGGKNALTDLKLVCTYTTYNGVEMTTTITDYVWNASDRAEFVVGLTAPNMRVPIQFQVYNGDVAVSEVATYSIESVMADNLSKNAAYANVISAVLNYSDAVADYF